MKCVRDVSEMCQRCVRDVSEMCQRCVRDVSEMCEKCVRNIVTRAILHIFYKLRPNSCVFYKLRPNSAVIFNYFSEKNKIKFLTRAILRFITMLLAL